MNDNVAEKLVDANQQDLTSFLNDTAGCGDDSAYKVQCPLWAQNGECKKNPTWMKAHCRKSCQSCSKYMKYIYQASQCDKGNRED